MSKPKVPILKLWRIGNRIMRALPEIIDAIDEADDPDSEGGTKVTPGEVAEIMSLVGQKAGEIVLDELLPRRKRR